MSDREIRHMDLCSGIGGFALGIAAAGRAVSTVAMCEIEPYCQAVLRKHWPDVPIYDDIKRFEAVKYKPIDILTAGYPCQPFSLASGKRKGTADDRHLWPWVFEIVKQCRPTWCIFENVPGHITLGLDEVLFDLESEAYAARTIIAGAVAVDAPHRRQRIWICARNVAHADSEREPDVSLNGEQVQGELGKDVADTESNGCNGRPSKTGRQGQKDQSVKQSGVRSKPGGSGEDVADTSRQRKHRTWGEGRGGQQHTNGGWWPAEPRILRVAHGIPNRVHRIKGLGNAVCSPLVTQIFTAVCIEEGW